MLPFPMRGLSNLERYQKDCDNYNKIIEMFAELGSGKLERRDVLNNIKNMIKNGLVEELETTIENIELYESWN